MKKLFCTGLMTILITVLLTNLVSANAFYHDTDVGIEKSFKQSSIHCLAICHDVGMNEPSDCLPPKECGILPNLGDQVNIPASGRNSRIQYNYPFVNPSKGNPQDNHLILRE